MNRVPRPLPILLWIIATAIMLQASLAGGFIAGVADVQFAHMVVGSILPYAALPVALMGVVRWRRGTVRPAVGLATAMLPVPIWVQMALGHVPFPVSTAIHVPLGTALLAYTVLLAVAAGRPSRRDRRAPRRVDGSAAPSGPGPADA